MLSFYIGGIKSGKSTQAYRRAQSLNGTVAVLTFGDETIDSEFANRIAHHRSSRIKDWKSFELTGSKEELGILCADKTFLQSETFILECMGTLLGRIMDFELDEYFLQNNSQPLESAIEERIEASFTEYILKIIEVLNKKNLIIISNEVGCAPVPLTPSGRFFVDVLGRANQRVAACADESFLCVAGKLIQLP